MLSTTATSDQHPLLPHREAAFCRLLGSGALLALGCAVLNSSILPFPSQEAAVHGDRLPPCNLELFGLFSYPAVFFSAIAPNSQTLSSCNCSTSGFSSHFSP